MNEPLPPADGMEIVEGETVMVQELAFSYAVTDPACEPFTIRFVRAVKFEELVLAVAVT